MKKISALILFTLTMITAISAYEFTGAKWPGMNPVVGFYFNEEGCEDVPDEWEPLTRSFKVWDEVPGSVLETEYLGMTDVNEIAKDGKNIVKWADKKDWPLGPRVICEFIAARY